VARGVARHEVATARGSGTRQRHEAAACQIGEDCLRRRAGAGQASGWGVRFLFCIELSTRSEIPIEVRGCGGQRPLRWGALIFYGWVAMMGCGQAPFDALIRNGSRLVRREVAISLSLTRRCKWMPHDAHAPDAWHARYNSV